jgi:hypothetical protein
VSAASCCSRSARRCLRPGLSRAAALDQTTRPASLDGCPMYAPPALGCRGAYMGRRRRGAAPQALDLEAFPTTWASPGT